MWLYTSRPKVYVYQQAFGYTHDFLAIFCQQNSRFGRLLGWLFGLLMEQLGMDCKHTQQRFTGVTNVVQLNIHRLRRIMPKFCMPLCNNMREKIYKELSGAELSFYQLPVDLNVHQERLRHIGQFSYYQKVGMIILMLYIIILCRQSDSV